MYKIMLVDDDSTSLAIGRALLESDYELVLAKSGIQALGAMKSGKLPDLVLLDMVMPGLDGLGLLRKMKRDPALAQIPIVFLTSENDLDKEIEGYGSGAADFLRKPVSPELLRIKIQRQLAAIALERENAALKRSLKALHDQFEELFSTFL